jgi:hypothetical protein
MRLRARKVATALAIISTLGMAAPAAAFAAYGSIVVGNSGAGKSWGFPTKHSAIRKARHECETVTTNCSFALWVSGSKCAATFYNKPSHTKVYYAFANSKARAEAKVLAAHPNAIFITAVCADHK